MANESFFRYRSRICRIASPSVSGAVISDLANVARTSSNQAQVFCPLLITSPDSSMIDMPYADPPSFLPSHWKDSPLLDEPAFWIGVVFFVLSVIAGIGIIVFRITEGNHLPTTEGYGLLIGMLYGGECLLILISLLCLFSSIGSDYKRRCENHEHYKKLHPRPSFERACFARLDKLRKAALKDPYDDLI